METHDARTERLEKINRRSVDRSPRYGGAGLGLLEAKFQIIGFKRLVPAHYLGGLRFGHLMAEEVEIDGSRQRGEALQRRFKPNSIKHGAGHGTQAAGLGNGDGEGLVLYAGHWGLNDWKFGIKQ
ncbi:hypothetical protein GCM10010080_24800 [Thermomonas carbonis]|nr:hypothetical protein GCM10010080_24800 [Thermomonas carbonis]